MLRLIDLRQYISGLGIAQDTRCYIGKLDAKKEKSIGIYNRKSEGALALPLGGINNASYDVRPVSFLVHWNKSVSESEAAAYALFDSLQQAASGGFRVGAEEIQAVFLQVRAPVDIGTDDAGVYEYVIWADFIARKG